MFNTRNHPNYWNPMMAQNMMYGPNYHPGMNVYHNDTFKINMPMIPEYQKGYPYQHMPMPPNSYPIVYDQGQWHGGNDQQDYVHKQYKGHLFQNPLQPNDDSYYHPTLFNNGGIQNPYPKQSIIPKQPKGFQTVMNSFKDQDGSLNLNKMVDTAGQMMNAVSQVSSMVKGLGTMFKA